MGDKVLLGFRRYMIPIPGPIWRAVVSKNARKFEKELSFMSEEHQLVRNYVVQALPQIGEPISAEYIADKMNIHIDRVKVILDDLEQHMTFLCRYGQSEVNWAYPVTVDQTPHSITYSTGERGYAA
ncbi:MAG: hypothetical protein RI591_06280 [Dehalococcoidia bacterium]|nr:hypothetical protein [Dehalococcoidia bacterium]